jgi:hypothetical protein
MRVGARNEQLVVIIQVIVFFLRAVLGLIRSLGSLVIEPARSLEQHERLFNRVFQPVPQQVPRAVQHGADADLAQRAGGAVTLVGSPPQDALQAVAVAARQLGDVHGVVVQRAEAYGAALLLRLDTSFTR